MPAEPGAPAGPGAAASAAPVLLPLWRTALAGALHRGRSAYETRYLQLATVDAQGHPRNRTVVFRGFGPASELLILTDRRSAKYAELCADPRAEVAWYFPTTREQMRFVVQVAVHGEDSPPEWRALRQRLWDERGARGQAEWLGAVPVAALPVPVADFILLACRVQAGDHLQLRTDPQTHLRWWQEDGHWKSATVSP